MKAHRFSWMLYRGKIPEGMLVLHKCNHPYCVNPDHLYIGTRSDNINDAIAVGRKPGENLKLTKDDVVCIRKMLKDGIKHWLIAWIYQISKGHIRNIKRNVVWYDATCNLI